MAYRRRFLRDRRTYARRRLPFRRRGFVSTGGVDRSHFTQCLAVYHNPFSTATTNPKIPDGKVYASTGVRLQSVTEFQNDATDTMDILLFPGLSNGVCLQNGPGLGINHMPYRDHGRFSTDSQPVSVGAAIHKWRLVSQALKISLINNSDENDGWWEAIRVQGGPDSAFSATLDVTTDPDTLFIGAGTSTVFPAVSATSLVEHPTYCTGKLRDIHRYMFHLMPQGNDHDFNIVPRTPSALEFNSHQIDNEAYDMIFIRVHGRTGAQPTRLMLHCVSNQEIIYDEQSFMTRYHNNSPGNSQYFDRAKRSRQQNSQNHPAAKKPRAVVSNALVA